MKTVPREIIESVWERQCGLEESEVRDFMRRFLDEQPAVGIYLAAHSEELGDESDRSQLVPLAATVWESMTQVSGRRLKMVQPGVVERADAANIQMLETLEDVSEFEWRERVLNMFTGYNQQPLLAFCIQVLMADDEETPELAPERVGMESLWLKTVIDCFDQ